MTSSADTMECFYYPVRADSEFDWNNFSERVNEIIASNSSDYLWHKDKLEIVQTINDCNSVCEDKPQHLYSFLSYGNNIEDEWFVVYLMFCLTKELNNLIVQINDSDGDILLIEAEDELPKWAKPENMENRVYIYKNKVHIIPPSLIDMNKEASVQNAIKCLLENSDLTEASISIQNIIRARIDEYPDKSNNNIQKCIVKVPLELATILRMEPSFISTIVHSYCEHDALDVKSCRNLDFYEYVYVNVKFTKCLYAMLLHSKAIVSRNPEFFKSLDKKDVLGFKLTCGYKMLMSKTTCDIYSSKNFTKFLESLRKNGYFKENLVGSKDYCSLLEQAKSFYKFTISSTSANTRHNISELKSSETYLIQKENIKNNTDPLEQDDDDSWLNIEPEQLNDMLNKRYGYKSSFKNDIDPDKVSNELSKFLQKLSDIEGVERKEDEKDQIDFDADQFSESVNKMLNLLTNNDDDSSTDDDSDEFMDEDDCAVSDMIDSEIKDSLATDIKTDQLNVQDIIKNLKVSMKEEHLHTGPSSQIFKSIGLRKSDVLDSDDDD